MLLLNKRYLWIDAISIVQDHKGNKIQQIAQMDIIYGSATLTTASCGDDAGYGLPGISSTPRHLARSTVEVFQSWHMISMGISLKEVLDHFKWYTRG